jgi:hypothetical protein
MTTEFTAHIKDDCELEVLYGKLQQVRPTAIVIEGATLRGKVTNPEQLEVKTITAIDIRGEIESFFSIFDPRIVEELAIDQSCCEIVFNSLLPWCERLADLQIERCDINSDKAFEPIRLKTLSALTLCECRIKAAFFDSLQFVTTLRSLRLPGSILMNDGPRRWETAIGALEQLEFLEIGGVQLESDSLEILRSNLPNCELFG